MRVTPTVLFASLLSLAGPAAAADWQTLPRMPTPRSSVAVVTDHLGRVWAMGGNQNWGSSNNYTSVVEIFDGIAWQPGPPLPVARAGTSAVFVNGFIYYVGSARQDAPGGPHIVDRVVLRLDTTAASPTWSSTSVPPLNTTRGVSGAAVDKLGRIWVVGGHDYVTNLPLASVEIFDPARPELGWVAGPPLSVARSYLGVVAARDGFIYAIGGSAPGVHLLTVERIDPLSSSPAWSRLPDMPGPGRLSSRCVLGADDKIYLAGGWSGFGCMNTAIRFDPKFQRWEMIASLATYRSNIALALDRFGRVLAIGGDCVPPKDDVEGFDSTHPCLVDLNGDGEIDFSDIERFIALYAAGC